MRVAVIKAGNYFCTDQSCNARTTVRLTGLLLVVRLTVVHAKFWDGRVVVGPFLLPTVYWGTLVSWLGLFFVLRQHLPRSLRRIFFLAVGGPFVDWLQSGCITDGR